MTDIGDIDVFLGSPARKMAFDKRPPNTVPRPRELFAKLQAKHGTVLVVVDQPASIGAQPLAVARHALAGEAARVANRLHSLLTQIHPTLERVPGRRLQHPAVLALLERFGSPARSATLASDAWSP